MGGEQEKETEFARILRKTRKNPERTHFILMGAFANPNITLEDAAKLQDELLLHYKLHLRSAFMGAMLKRQKIEPLVTDGRPFE